MPNPYVNKVQKADGTVIIDISDTTAIAADVASGKYFYTAAGEKVAGTSSGGGGSGGVVITDTADAAGGTVRTITAVEISGTKTITENGTGIDVTSYEMVDVDVSGGGIVIEDVANATGITCVITSGGSPVPPTPETWETIFNGTAYANADTPYNYFWIQDMTNVYPAVGSEWRVTINGTPYRCTAYMLASANAVAVGNPKYSGGTDNGNDIPANFYNAGWGAMVGDTELASGVSHAVKFERLVEE